MKRKQIFKLLTIFGTRPEIIRLSEIIKACDLSFNHVLVHTGQNYDYELNQVFFEELGLRTPDYRFDCKSDNIGGVFANIFSKIYPILFKENPDAILILGDTNSALSSIIAKRMKIPVFHIEAGNRCGDWRVPETINRMIVDHISDINISYTNEARKNLIKEGLSSSFSFVCGSPMKEVLEANKRNIDKCDILSRFDLKKNEYIVLSTHREENIENDANFLIIIDSINEVANKYNLPIIFSVHPRTKNKISNTKVKLNPLIKCIKPLGFIEYMKLQENAFIVLSDSGTITEESYIMHFPAILMRTSTERPEGIKAGSIIMSGLDKKSILFSIEQEREKYLLSTRIPEYEVSRVSKRIIDIINKNIDKVNREIWHKE